MTRTLHTIKGKAVKFEGDSFELIEVRIPTQSYSEKEVEKAVRSYEEETGNSFNRKTLVTEDIPTRMSLSKWWKNCEIVSKEEAEQDEENDTENDTESD